MYSLHMETPVHTISIPPLPCLFCCQTHALLCDRCAWYLSNAYVSGVFTGGDGDSSKTLEGLTQRVKRQENLLHRCKETIRMHKERSAQLTNEKEALQEQLDERLQELEKIKVWGGITLISINDVAIVVGRKNMHNCAVQTISKFLCYHLCNQRLFWR